MGITVTRTVYEVLPEDIYMAEVLDIEEVEGDYGDQLKFTFDLVELDDRQQLGWCSKKLSPKSKLWAWTRALLGSEPDGDLDCDRLINRKCRLSLSVETKDGVEYNRIKDILPMARATIKPRPQPVVAQAQPEPEFSPEVNSEPPEDDGTEALLF
jgi:hypothetical protein